MIASGSKDRSVKLWNLIKMKEITSLQGHQKEVVAVAFSNDGKTLASCSIDTVVKLWNVNA
jgi:WD40 repeat protein